VREALAVAPLVAVVGDEVGILANIGIIRAALPFADPDWIGNLSPKLRSEFDAVCSRPMASFANDAIDAFQQIKFAQRPSATSRLLGKSPIIVLRHGKSGGWGRRKILKKSGLEPKQNLQGFRPAAA
jgi:hypothetical protein